MSDRYYLGPDSPPWADAAAPRGADLRARLRHPSPPFKLWIASGTPFAEVEAFFAVEYAWPALSDFGFVKVGDHEVELLEGEIDYSMEGIRRALEVGG